MKMVTFLTKAFLTVVLFGLAEGLKVPCGNKKCVTGEICADFCGEVDSPSCKHCLLDSTLGGECTSDSDCYDFHGPCTPDRCGCNDCGICVCRSPHTDTNGLHYGGLCLLASNLGSQCMKDTDCNDGEPCDGNRCGCDRRGKGKPQCRCRVDRGFGDSNGKDAGGFCTASNIGFYCEERNECFDKLGQCDGQRCDCDCNMCVCREPDSDSTFYDPVEGNCELEPYYGRK